MASNVNGNFITTGPVSKDAMKGMLNAAGSEITGLQDGKMPIGGGNFTGNVSGPLFISANPPTGLNDLAHKGYVDGGIATGVFNRTNVHNTAISNAGFSIPTNNTEIMAMDIHNNAGACLITGYICGEVAGAGDSLVSINAEFYLRNGGQIARSIPVGYARGNGTNGKYWQTGFAGAVLLDGFPGNNGYSVRILVQRSAGAPNTLLYQAGMSVFCNVRA